MGLRKRIRSLFNISSPRRYLIAGFFLLFVIVFIPLITISIISNISNIEYLVALVNSHALDLATISLTAGSILLSFFLTILADEKLQIGRSQALVMWLATLLLLITGLISILVFTGLDTIASLLSISNLLFALGLLIGIIGIWTLKRGYYEGGNNSPDNNGATVPNIRNTSNDKGANIRSRNNNNNSNRTSNKRNAGRRRRKSQKRKRK